MVIARNLSAINLGIEYYLAWDWCGKQLPVDLGNLLLEFLGR